MKKTLFSLCLLTVLSSVPVMAADEINFTINGSSADFYEGSSSPVIIEGRVYVPARTVFDAIGACAEWDNVTKTITAEKNGLTLAMTIGSHTQIINGKACETDAAPFIKNGFTFAPVRCIAEAFECSADWDAETKTVNITVPDYNYDEQLNWDKDHTIQWIANLSKTNNAPAPIDSNTFEDEAMKNLHQNIRGYFEQTALPEKILNDDGTLANIILNNTEEFTHEIDKIWDKNSEFFVLRSSSLEDEQNSAECGGVVYDMQKNTKLLKEENYGITITQTDDGRSVVILEMAEDEYAGSCLYIAIVYTPNDGFSYYTLETGQNNYLSLCKVTNAGHSKIGSFQKGLDMLYNREALLYEIETANRN